MSLKLSTGLRNKMCGMVGAVKAQISEDTYTSNLAFVDGGVGADTITDDGSNFITAGFAPGDVIYVYGVDHRGQRHRLCQWRGADRCGSRHADVCHRHR